MKDDKTSWADADWRAEIKRLEAENARLRTELREAEEMLFNQAQTILEQQAAARAAKEIPHE